MLSKFNPYLLGILLHSVASHTKQPPLSWEYEKNEPLPSSQGCHVFFGTGSSVRFSEDGDTWQFCLPGSCQNNTYFKYIPATFKPLDARPSPRKHFGMAVLHTGANQALLFGGISGSVLLGDTWIYENTNGKTCTELCDEYSYNTASWTNVSSSSSPTKRMFSQMVSLGPGKIIMFGGMNGDTFFDDTWVFSRDSGWKQHFPTSVQHWNGASIPGPVARIQHAMSAPYFDQVMLFGGANQDGNVLDDLWFFNQTVGTQGQWQYFEKAATNNWPDGRREHALTWLSSGNIAGSVLLFGGSDTENMLKGDTWIYKIKNSNGKNVMQWFQVDTGRKDDPDYLDFLSERWGMALSSLPDSRAILSGGTDAYNSKLSSSLIFSINNVSSDGNYSGVWETADVMGRLNTQAHLDHAIGELGDGKAVLFGGSTGSSANQEKRKVFPDCITRKTGDVETQDNLTYCDSEGSYFEDTWVFDLKKADSLGIMDGTGVAPWSRIRMSSIRPPKREDHTLTGIDANHAIMFAGIYGEVTL
jgi:hypothetical protein